VPEKLALGVLLVVGVSLALGLLLAEGSAGLLLGVALALPEPVRVADGVVCAGVRLGAWCVHGGARGVGAGVCLG
jgi:hypothetical protein